MADTAVKEEKTEETKPAENTADASTGPETTTANDSSLAINQDPAAPKLNTEEAKDEAEDKTTEPAEDTLIQTPTAPVVVSDADVAAAEKEADPHQSLAEQIEVLTGEVQALEAKIERLTSGVGEVPAPVAPVAEEPAPPEIKAPEPKIDEPKQSEPAIPVVAPQPVPIAKASSIPAAPVNDIYNKLLSTPNEPVKSNHRDLNDDTTIEEGSSGIGTIGEVLIVFGIIALVVLGASPFFKSMIGTNWDALKSIGWPTAAISLALGFLLFLFNKGRIVFKIFALILALIAGVMTAAIFDYGSMLGPLSSLLDPIASFYK